MIFSIKILFQKNNHFSNKSNPFLQTNSPIEIRAVADIKEGEEITISYVNEYDYGLKDRKSRQEVLLRGRFFLCQCEYCENGPRDNDKILQGMPF